MRQKYHVLVCVIGSNCCAFFAKITEKSLDIFLTGEMMLCFDLLTIFADSLIFFCKSLNIKSDPFYVRDSQHESIHGRGRSLNRLDSGA
jgi:hypothetical protein